MKAFAEEVAPWDREGSPHFPHSVLGWPRDKTTIHGRLGRFLLSRTTRGFRSATGRAGLYGSFAAASKR
jgi:hypothetical protein